MTPDTLNGIVERNSRNVELMKRTTEQALSDLSWQQLTLEQNMFTRLGNIAALHLQHGTAHDAEVIAALQGRQQAQDLLRQQLQSAEQEVAQALAGKANLQAQIDGIDQQARESLENDPDYAQRVEQLDQAQAAHREHISGYEDLRQECAQKRPTFDVNPIYCYLRSHAFGTETYRRNRIHRAMDAWLASKVNYAANRKNELRLIAMNERNEAMQIGRETLIQTLGSTIDAQLATARAQLGLATLLSQVGARETLVNDAKGRANSIQQQLAAFASNLDPHYLRARELLTDQLKTQSIGQLIDRASQTPDETDDRIVEQLQALHSQLQTMESDKGNLQHDLQDLHTRYERAKDLQRKLRNGSFTGSDFYFDLSTDFERLLASYMDGDTTLGRVIDVLNEGRTLVRRSQAATRQGFVSTSTTSYGFTTTTTTANSASQTTTSFSSSRSEFKTTDSF